MSLDVERVSPKARRARGWSLLLALTLGAALRWPALQLGFFGDDYLQLAMLRGQFVLQRAPWDLFWFGPGSAAERTALQSFGFLPWWSAQDLRIAMWRPLASLLIWFDATCFGDNAVPMHVHSLLWWALLVVVVWRLLFRLLPGRAAALGTVAYALDEAHTIPASWLANRSTLVAAVFGVLALDAHLRARQEGQARTAWLAALCWTAAFAAGEYAFGLAAYAVAYELTSGRRSTRLRSVSALALALPALGFLSARAVLGYGVHASGYYFDPTAAAYFGALPRRALAALAELVLGVPSGWAVSGSPWGFFLVQHGWLSVDAFLRLPEFWLLHCGLGAAALLAMGFGGRALMRREQHGALSFLLAGSALAVLAAAGALPSSRLLVGAELGVAAAVGATLAALWGHVSTPGLPLARRVVAGAALAAVASVHLGYAGYYTADETAARKVRATTARARALSAPLRRDASQLDVVIVGATDFTTETILPWVRVLHGLGPMHSYRRLSGAFQAHELTRIDAHTLEVRVLSSHLAGAFSGSLYRPATRPIQAGERFAAGDLTVEVLQIRDDNPARYRVRFARALDDPHLLFLHAFDRQLHRLELPAQGETLRLPLAAVPWM